MLLKELTPNPNNPRTISEDKLKMLSDSMNRFGSLDGFVFNRRTGRLVGGHQRQKLAADAEVHIQNRYETPTMIGTIAEGFVLIHHERFPYREVDWSEDVEKAASIAANKGAGEWDATLLSTQFSDLETQGFELDLTMFTEDERNAYKTPREETREGKTEVPQVQESFVKVGDIWKLGSHRLMCGDSTRIDAVEKLMNGEKADMVFTDPPYGINLDTDYLDQYGGGQALPGRKNHTAHNIKHKPIKNDDVEFNPEVLLEYFDYCSEIFLWGANYYWQHLPNNLTSSIVIWDKRVSNELRKMHGNQLEICWSKEKHSQIIIPITWCGAYGSDEGKAGHKKVHPTQKPVKLAVTFFENWGENGDQVVDLFGGSGSTLIACEKTNRKCFMSELDPHYVDVIIKRWINFTGQMAYLIEDSTGPLQEPVQYADINSFRRPNIPGEFKNIADENVGQSEDPTEIKNVKTVKGISL